MAEGNENPGVGNPYIKGFKSKNVVGEGASDHQTKNQKGVIEKGY